MMSTGVFGLRDIKTASVVKTNQLIEESDLVGQKVTPLPMTHKSSCVECMGPNWRLYFERWWDH